MPSTTKPPKVSYGASYYRSREFAAEKNSPGLGEEHRNIGPCKCSREGRNLVVCIDGTSNQFGKYNTNVIQLYSQIVKTDDQLTYYNSGVGTYAQPSWKSFKFWMQVLDNKVDLVIAWNFEKIIMGAYRWLSENYQENDRIYLFGFSRGAYQVRALAGMIQKVGLIHKGNEEQIPFAYELYATQPGAGMRKEGDAVEKPKSFCSEKFSGLARRCKRFFSKNSQAEKTQNGDGLKNIDLAARFKDAFSRPNVRVHFVGVWDTVSSVGITRGKTLPLTDSSEHLCFFRQALALDERRVKFLPEYVHGGTHVKEDNAKNKIPRIKEVWFPGTHSDIGGGNRLNVSLDLCRTPMLWMSYEALCSGLQLKPSKAERRWRECDEVKESMTAAWSLLEWLPLKRLTYKDSSSTTHRLHRSNGRQIVPGQKIHATVAFYNNRSYFPKASLWRGQLEWVEILGCPPEARSKLKWPNIWMPLLELDLCDLSLLPEILETLKSLPDNLGWWIYRLLAIALPDDGRLNLLLKPDLLNDLLELSKREHTELSICVTAILRSIYLGDLDGYFPPQFPQWKQKGWWCLTEATALEEVPESYDRWHLTIKLLILGLSEEFHGTVNNDANNTALKNEIFTDSSISIALRYLTSEDWHMRRLAVEFLTAAALDGRYAKKIRKAKATTVLLKMMVGDDEMEVRISAGEFFRKLVPAFNSSHHDQIFDANMISVLRKMLDIDSDSSNVASVVSIFRDLASEGWLQDQDRKIFDTGTVAALQRVLSADLSSSRVKAEAVRFFMIAAYQATGELQREIFNEETISALRRLQFNGYIHEAVGISRWKPFMAALKNMAPDNTEDIVPVRDSQQSQPPMSEEPELLPGWSFHSERDASPSNVPNLLLKRYNTTNTTKGRSKSWSKF